MTVNLPLRRREIADYADTIMILRSQGADPQLIIDAERDLANMRRKLAEDLIKEETYNLTKRGSRG